MSTQPTPEWQPIATAPKDGTVFEAIYQDGTTDEICWALERVHPGGSSREAACGEGWATMNEGCRYAPVDEPTHWRPLYEWHNPSNLTDEEVGVKDGWRLCLKTETEHEGCEWLSPGLNRWASDYIYEGESLDPSYTYRTRRPLPESATEPKEGGEICLPQPAHAVPLIGKVAQSTEPGTSNAAAGTSNPDQQAASVQLPWLEQQQRDREALAAETDQAPPQEPAGDGVKWPYNDPRFVGYFSGVPVNGRGHRIHPPTAPAVAEQELLPCPFCGKMPNVEECEEGQGVYVWCETKECPMHGLSPSRDKWNRRPAAPVAVGETPETDALLTELHQCLASWAPDARVLGNVRAGDILRALHTIHSERDAARRERDEANMSRDGAWIAYKETTRVLESIAVAMELTCDYDADVVIEALATLQSERDEARKQNTLFEEEMDAIRTVRDIARERCKKQEEQLTALTAERDELMRRFTVIGRLIRKALPNICNPEGFPYERTLGIIREHRKLAAERDRLREELDMTRGSERILAQGFAHLAKQLGHTGDDCNPEIVSQLIADLKAALATAQADIAELCSVIVAAFAETAKPLNASVEYDATPTAAERLKKVQEILASAIDAASATEGGQP